MTDEKVIRVVNLRNITLERYKVDRQETPFAVLASQKIERIELDYNIIIFITATKRYLMFHFQDCCENVEIEEVIGNLDILIENPVIQAERVSVESFDCRDSAFQWTFYKLANVDESVTIRWRGSSNGYYSTDVSFIEIENDA